MFEVPAFIRPIELRVVVAATTLLVGAPVLGWLIQRAVADRAEGRRALGPRPSDETSCGRCGRLR